MRRKCIDQWEWIVNNRSNKLDWAFAHPDLRMEVKFYNKCYACLYANLNCENCPVTWGDDVEHCEQEGSLYLKWVRNKTSLNAKLVLDAIKNTWRK